jgi:hypothetical protein
MTRQLRRFVPNLNQQYRKSGAIYLLYYRQKSKKAGTNAGQG